MSKTPAELATMLVEAFGRPDDIAALLAEDATWWVTPSSPAEVMDSVSVGREKIRGNMQRVFSNLYVAESCDVVVHAAISDGNLGAVRITFNAQFPRGGNYSNEYSLWVEVDDDKIIRVWEYVDAAHALTQMQAASINFAPTASSQH